MVRVFPRGRPAHGARTRRGAGAGRLGVLGALAALLAGLLTLPTAPALGADADQLRERQAEVSERLDEANGDLGHSSVQLIAAVAALEAAEEQLDDARQELERTRVELAAAEELDRTMQARLDAAVRRLAQARAQLAEGREQVERQRAEVADWAASSFQSNDSQLMELRVLLGAQTPETLTTQMDAVDSVSDKNADRFDRLQAAEVLLQVNEDEVEAARDEVAERRAAAAANLEQKQQLEARAEAAHDTIATLVSERAAAMRAAQQAKAEDRQQIAALESERSRIESELAAIAASREAERLRQQAAAASTGSVLNSGGFLSYPVNTYVTSPYGQRFHPILHYWKLHDGTDFGAGCGLPIRAAADGVVLSMYYNGGYGNRVIIDHGVQKGVSLSTSYNHLSQFGTFIGDTVEQGEVIGYVGTTGYSTGCHLHFMVYENGGTVDPMSWL